MRVQIDTWVGQQAVRSSRAGPLSRGMWFGRGWEKHGTARVFHGKRAVQGSLHHQSGLWTSGATSVSTRAGLIDESSGVRVILHPGSLLRSLETLSRVRST